VIPGVAPITPLTSILPLLFVLCVTAIKDAWDDWVCAHVHSMTRHRLHALALTLPCFAACGVYACVRVCVYARQNRRKADNQVNNRTALISERDFVRGSLAWRNVTYKVQQRKHHRVSLDQLTRRSKWATLPV
jgi:hypothetical protein